MSFLPTNIPNCVLWLDSTDETTMTLYGGVYLQQWRDKTSSVQFDYYYGYPVLYRNVSNSQSAFLFSAAQSVNNASFAFPNTAYSLFGILFATGGFYRRFINGGGPDADSHLFFGSLNYNAACFTGNDGWNDTNGTNVAIGGGYNLVEMIVDGTTLSIYVNGSLAETKTGTTAPFSGLNIGGFAFGTNDQAWLGYGGDIVLYNTALSTLYRQQAEGCLAWKWGIQNLLPAGHPYRNAPPSAFTTIPLGIPTAQALQLQSPPTFSYPLPSGATLVPAISEPFPITISQPSAQILNKKWLPTIIPELSLWLDAADRSTLTFTGNTVTTWIDKSINTYDATGFGSTTLTLFNSKQYGIALNGTDTYFYSSNATPMNTTESLSAFVVGTFGSMGASEWRRLLSFGDPDYLSTGNCVAFERYATNEQITYERNGYVAPSLTLTPPQNFVGSVVFSPSNIQQYINGELNASATTSLGAFNYSLYNIARYSGGGYIWTGTICEVITYNSALTTSDRQKVEGYLAWKWGFPLSLPGNHPYRLFPPPPSPIQTASSEVVVIFNYVGSALDFVVPVGITSLTVYLWGAGGGGYGATDYGQYNGGAGAYVSGTLSVTPGENLGIIVGLGGSPNADAGTLDQGGGGSSGRPSPGNTSSGGGRSAIQRSSDDVVTAGGGSGSGWAVGAAATWFGTSNPGTSPFANAGGGAGTQSAGGALGLTDGYTPGTAGSKGLGGNGSDYASGGGGGWYGGGGGGVTGGNGGTGGAGSSYIDLLTDATGENGSVPNAPNTSSPYYQNNAGRGGSAASTSGGNGLIVVKYMKTSGSDTIVRFTSTGTIQSFTVPNGVGSISIYCWGAGGTSSVQYGGTGAYAAGVYSVSPGQTYYIIVGTTAVTGLANGGGSIGYGGGGGGGFSGVFTDSSPATGNALLIAGGGGGGGVWGSGGGGGYPDGLTGLGLGYATGGTQDAGGIGGSWLYKGGYDGTQLAGGDAGSVQPGGGGGGGGWWGGGGGFGPVSEGYGGGGGGGSSHAGPGVTSVEYANGNTGGGNAGNEASPYWQSPYGRASENGLVVIRY